jgi:DHA2 family multidrug resistance protein
MGMIFTPLNSLSLATIPRDKMAQASGISNTVRQIGGSMGVALLSTLLTDRVNFHSQIYGGSILTGSQIFQNTTHNLAVYIQHTAGGTFVTALKQGQAVLMSHVGSQAFIQGVNDDFMIAAGITAISFVPIFLMHSKKKLAQKK